MGILGLMMHEAVNNHPYIINDLVSTVSPRFCGGGHHAFTPPDVYLLVLSFAWTLSCDGATTKKGVATLLSSLVDASTSRVKLHMYRSRDASDQHIMKVLARLFSQTHNFRPSNRRLRS